MRTVTPSPHRTAAAGRAPARAAVLRRCACGGKSPGGGECAECRAKRLRRSASATGPAAAPSIVHDVLAGAGAPLDAGTRAFMEPRFGHSFADVRVHADARAAASARAVGARAYAVGRDVVFGAGSYAPSTGEGRRLIAHELAHVVQQGSAPAPVVSRALEVGPVDAPEEREADAAAERIVAGADAAVGAGAAPALRREPFGAAYPTREERDRLQETFNPQQSEAAATGEAPKAVEKVEEFKKEMRSRVEERIRENLPDAQKRKASTVEIGFPELKGLADVVEEAVRKFYGNALKVRGEPQAGGRLRENLGRVSDITPQVGDVACNWVADRMDQVGRRLMNDHHVLASSSASKATCDSASCPGGKAPGPDALRDQALFDGLRDEIFCANRADVETLILYQATFERTSDSHAFIQTRIAPEPGDDAETSMRRGRWEAAGTLIHEMLHMLAHPDFRPAVAGLENSGIAIEGFAEYFTRPVYEELRRRAKDDDAFRASIEGTGTPKPWRASLAPDREKYQDRVDAVNGLIANVLGASDANVRAAFFLGKVEFLGLGGWTEEESRKRAPLRYPANSFGAIGLFSPAADGEKNGHGGVRLQYGRVLLGRGGPLQLRIEGGVQYLGTGDLLQGFAGGAVRYQGDHLFVQGGASLAAGGSLSGQGSRVDLAPELRAGVRIGAVNLGPSLIGILPIGGTMNEKTKRLAIGLGLSAEF